MNKKQLITMWVGIIVLVLMSIFPPWTGEVTRESGTQTHLSTIYVFIFNFPDEDSLYHIDIAKLLIQYSIIGLITFGLIITFKNTKLKNEQT